MAKQAEGLPDNLNLPDGVSQLYQRRYSDPGKASKEIAPSPRPRRRFSLSTFDDLKDISSGKIRSCVNNILKTSGFTAFSKAKCDQMRRYSQYVDPEVVNNLVGERGDLAGTSFLSRSMSQGENPPYRACNSPHNADTNRLLFRKRSLTSYIPKSDIATVGKSYKPHGNNNVPHMCPSPTEELSFYDRRRSKQCHQDEYDCTPSQKCKYKLRENGVLASELASSFGVHIEDVNIQTPAPEHMRSSNGNVSPCRPETPLNQATRARKHSNPTFTKNQVSLKQRKILNDSPLSDGVSTYTDTWPTIQRQPVHSKATPNEKGMIELAWPSEDPRHSKTLQKMRKAFLRQNSKINFEVIGSETIHGSPNYSGRLKLCSFRTPLP